MKLSLLATIVLASCQVVFAQQDSSKVVVDSAVTRAESLRGVPSSCPQEILDSLVLLDVEYWSFDGNMHRGQVVVHKELVDDVKHVFSVALREKFPIESAVPVSSKRFERNSLWDDELSMEANNTSCFNFRPVTGGKKLSNHSYGRAIDINPKINPYIKGDVVLPKGAQYDPSKPGVITRESAITRAFLERGWQWGGDWTSLKDYQHFEKPAAQ